MKKNTFLKTTLRQPLRTALMLLLVAASSFALIMRAEEYSIVHNAIMEVSKYYRTIGFLQSESVDMENPLNTYDAVHLLAESDFVDVADIRRGTLAIMDIQNAHIHGMDTFWQDPNLIPRRSEALFYGRVLYSAIDVGYVRLNIDYVVAGYPEHVIAGQELRLNFDPELLQPTLERGERYLLRGLFLPPLIGGGNILSLPVEGSSRDTLTMLPLTDELWYFPAPDGEVDLTQEIFGDLAQETDILQKNQRIAYVIRTDDLSAHPFVQREFDIFRLADGRWIDHNDHISANPVAVINRHFAELRGLEVGDSLSMNLIDIHDSSAIPRRYHDWENRYTQSLQLEIVGIFTVGPAIDFGVWTPQSETIYIPHSVFSPMLGGDPYSVFARDFSFTLRDTRDEAEFMLAYKDIIEDMGYTLTIIPSGADNFWDAAEPILRSANFNLITFSILSILVLVFTSALFLWQRRKDIAILKALGCPSRKIYFRTHGVVLLFIAPAAIVGAFLGRHYAGALAMDNLHEVIAYFEDGEGFQVLQGLTAAHFTVIVFAIIAFFAASMHFQLMGYTRRSPLELLQGRKNTKRR